MQAVGYPANSTFLSQGRRIDAELGRCPRMDECSCSQGWREGTPTDERGFKAKFGYDDRKGVGACYRRPSFWEELLPQLRRFP